MMCALPGVARRRVASRFAEAFERVGLLGELGVDELHRDLRPEREVIGDPDRAPARLRRAALPAGTYRSGLAQPR